MYTFVLHLHSYSRYLILLLFLFIVLRSMYALLLKSSHHRWDGIANFLLVAFIHLQVISGIILYIVSPLVSLTTESMRHDIQRYWTVEHITMMLIASVISMIGFLKGKKATTASKAHRMNLIFQGIAFLMILLTIWISGRGII